MQPILPSVDDSDEAKAIVAEWLQRYGSDGGDDYWRGKYIKRLLIARVEACRHVIDLG